MQSMFNNAFNTKAGALVEKATLATLTSEDWALNMEICDLVRTYEEGPKDALKAIKRRLTNNKNQTQIMYTLTVLETCVKNCGSRFHILITSKEFCNDVLVKLIQGKNVAPLVLQNKVLGLIQEWAEAFKSTAAMKGVVEVYEELKEKGWEFPQQDKASSAPIITPKRSVPPSQPPVHHQMFNPTQQGQGLPTRARPSTGPITPSQEQVAKLRSELDIVNGNTQVMSEMLTELHPGSDPSDIDLLQELNRTCRAMQQRVMELIERVSNEELTVGLLKVNDDLNNVFLRYERFERFRTNQPLKAEASSVPSSVPASYTSSQPVEPPPSYSDTEQPAAAAVSDLIDFGGLSEPVQPPPPAQPPAPSVTDDLAGLNLDPLMKPTTAVAAYPDLSQNLAQFGGTAPADIAPSTPDAATRNAAEMEQWLQAGGETVVSPTTPEAEGNAAVTDEFTAFLNERAAVGGQLPTMPDVPTNPVGQSDEATSDPRQRKMETGNQPMFGL